VNLTISVQILQHVFSVDGNGAFYAFYALFTTSKGLLRDNTNQNTTSSSSLLGVDKRNWTIENVFI